MLGLLVNLNMCHRMELDDIEIKTIEIEKVVGVQYPKGWKFIDSNHQRVKRVLPYLLGCLGTSWELESVANAELAAN